MKTYDVYLLPDAIKDLEAIYEYIAEQSGFPERAWTDIERLRKKCQELEMAPQRGQQRHDLLEKLRVYPLDKKTVAAFVIDEGQRTVSILNVFYGGRDYETIMSANKS
jgi:plasmid stabilization system protein ParE